ncbi:DM13 domain-containing protein [Hoeflea sp.]|uniref:DM13 domain-containing protein n=1 Tax=Hoeflea sp. TaxID=1940281 RepID=UPI0019922993|nr:DM13 domain-containing protein [Hoeflea sp.]MBC7281787.1 DM13 domain-containing protein [Hoeflea sp.]
MLRWIVLAVTHTLTLAIGFALGIYLLPILVAPPAPDQATLSQTMQFARYQAEFSRDLRGSDFLHWGEGTVSISPLSIAHQGRLAPGPDYKLYLVPQFIEDEAQFLAIRDTAQLIGDIKTFDGFLLDVPQSVDIDAYTTVLVWCETFGEFISAAKYR